MSYQRSKRDPRTKEEVLDRVLAYDFNGDIRDIGAETARITRTGPNKLLLHFPVSGRTYEVTVRMPRAEQRKPLIHAHVPVPVPVPQPPQQEARKTRPSRRIKETVQASVVAA